MSLFNWKSESREARFWKWFAANSPRLREFETDQERVFSSLEKELHRVHRGLLFEFGPVDEETGRRHLAISADGITEVFPAVEKLVAAAPDLPGWRILAFRQRTGTDMRIKFADVELSADDIRFVAEREPTGTVGLTLFVRGLTEETQAMYMGAVFLLLDSALGEYDVATKIGGIEWVTLPDDPSFGGKPFEQLPDVVDDLAR